MELNNLTHAGSRTERKRVGRGIGSGLGKTCGRGHKGQKSRSGGYHKVGFEGGQMPLQRRLPKVGFTSRKKLTSARLPISALNKLSGEVTLARLIEENLIAGSAKRCKIYLSGELASNVQIKGIAVSAGAKAMIESAGGSVSE
ncbi:50S ribosomal protein L15 [Ostreibacterium oceani]|uniref:Large ribosomal subunit protein uL15 n=1 Tax=Ostreibacterium oceani TaxID=2654998 RepID=A0A6N7ET70_9GAMM|nr:50S ribosomal protein L15 [Ostreibacterium oceani]MPV85751.1 50S ribosomal protein L15 [Ostreibacterium oceani]